MVIHRFHHVICAPTLIHVCSHKELVLVNQKYHASMCAYEDGIQ